MDNTELHYVSYDPEAIWRDMVSAYYAAGGETLHPGDEKEILLRAVLQIMTTAFAGIDNALRMDTLRYAVRDYLDVYGEKRNCPRIRAEAATASVSIVMQATGRTGTIPQGAPLTEDGEMTYLLNEEIPITGQAQTVEAEIVCSQAGAIGNGLLSGAALQFVTGYDAVTSVTVLEDATGGQDEETDEVYRERIRTNGLATVTTGPAEQYRSAAMAVSSQIVDAAAINGGNGVVNVYLLLSSSTGSDAIIAAVAAALSADNVRPLTDNVSVQLATAKEYTLNVTCTIPAGVNISEAITDAVAEYKTWQETVIGQPFNPDKLMAMLYQAGCSRVVFTSGSEFDGGTAEYTAIAANQYCTGTIAVTEA